MQTQASPRVVVIGADAAGMSGASQIKRAHPHWTVRAFDRSPFSSFSLWGLPYYVGRLVDNAQQLITRTPQDFLAHQDIHVGVRHVVEQIDIAQRWMRVRSLEDGHTASEPFDALLIATGAVPICPPVYGMAAAGIYTVNTLQQGLDLRDALDRNPPRRVVVVGAGAIGLEMAENLIARGIAVSVVERAPQVLPPLDPDMAALVAHAVEAMGASLYLTEALQGFDTHNGRVTAVVTPQRTLPADVVILGLGVRPNVELAAAAGLVLGVQGAIQVNDRMQTSVEGVWAAGDCVASYHVVSGQPVYGALGTVANKQGRIAGLNIARGQAVFPGVAGTAITKVHHTEIARTGLQTADFARLPLDGVSVTIESTTKARYYPGAENMTVKMFAEKGTGRILGGQIVGGAGAAKRIDVIVMALYAGLTVDQLVNVDLAYAPPFSPTWDPVLIAARALLHEV